MRIIYSQPLLSEFISSDLQSLNKGDDDNDDHNDADADADADACACACAGAGACADANAYAYAYTYAYAYAHAGKRIRVCLMFLVVNAVNRHFDFKKHCIEIRFKRTLRLRCKGLISKF